MKIESLKELKALIDLCHKMGVNSITVDSISLELGERPRKAIKRTIKPIEPLIPGDVGPDTPIRVDQAWDSLTDEQKLFYSVRQE